MVHLLLDGGCTSWNHSLFDLHMFFPLGMTSLMCTVKWLHFQYVSGLYYMGTNTYSFEIYLLHAYMMLRLVPTAMKYPGCIPCLLGERSHCLKLHPRACSLPLKICTTLCILRQSTINPYEAPRRSCISSGLQDAEVKLVAEAL